MLPKLLGTSHNGRGERACWFDLRPSHKGSLFGGTPLKPWHFLVLEWGFPPKSSAKKVSLLLVGVNLRRRHDCIIVSLLGTSNTNRM